MVRRPDVPRIRRRRTGNSRGTCQRRQTWPRLISFSTTTVGPALHFPVPRVGTLVGGKIRGLAHTPRQPGLRTRECPPKAGAPPSTSAGWLTKRRDRPSARPVETNSLTGSNWRSAHSHEVIKLSQSSERASVALVASRGQKCSQDHRHGSGILPCAWRGGSTLRLCQFGVCSRV